MKVRLKAPDGMTTLTVMQASYPISDGHVDVDERHVSLAFAFGCTYPPADAAAETVAEPTKGDDA